MAVAGLCVHVGPPIDENKDNVLATAKTVVRWVEKGTKWG
jgi:hypothetical protein